MQHFPLLIVNSFRIIKLKNIMKSLVVVVVDMRCASAFVCLYRILPKLYFPFFQFIPYIGFPCALYFGARDEN